PSGPQICTQEPTQSPASRPGFCIFSALNLQCLAFTCQKNGQIADYPHQFIAISEPYLLHLKPF
ncbi:hypothetical protein, partial [Aeromonas sp. PI_26]|uniref:hypothetical protein n=1 Tax=Aeromonas sp. PI_26 TaxID=2899138 RepID=UPI0022EB52E7